MRVGGVLTVEVRNMSSSTEGSVGGDVRLAERRTIVMMIIVG